MKIYATRDSVAAADDLHAPHGHKLSLGSDVQLKEALQFIQSKYLPNVQGGLASWSVTSNIPVAVLAQQWREPKILLWPPDEKKLDSVNGVLHLHFNYHDQLDPEVVYEVLRRVRFNAI